MLFKFFLFYEYLLSEKYLLHFTFSTFFYYLLLFYVYGNLFNRALVSNENIHFEKDLVFCIWNILQNRSKGWMNNGYRYSKHFCMDINVRANAQYRETRDIFGLVNFIAFPVRYLNEKAKRIKVQTCSKSKTRSRSA